jgi:hypothetical protein
MALWSPLASNTFDAMGFFTAVDTNTTGSPMRFYRLSSP